MKKAGVACASKESITIHNRLLKTRFFFFLDLTGRHKGTWIIHLGMHALLLNNKLIIILNMSSNFKKSNVSSSSRIVQGHMVCKVEANEWGH